MAQNFNTLTIPELKDLARSRGFGGLTRLRKNELVLLLQQVPQPTPQPTPQTIRQTTPQPIQQGNVDLTLLPRDMQIEVISHMDPIELIQMCTSNKQLNQLCQDERFWKQSVQNKYGNVVQINKSWKETYIINYQYEFIQSYINIFKSPSAFYLAFISRLMHFMTIIPGESNLPEATLDYNQLNAQINSIIMILSREIREDYTYFKSMDLLNKLKDPKILKQLINFAIPGLHYITISTNYIIIPGLPNKNVNSKINKYNISLLDLLKTFKILGSLSVARYYQVFNIVENDNKEIFEIVL